jgi:hypothetical protein
MTDLRQAAQQALDALTWCHDWPGAYDECNQAVQALRAALAAQQPSNIEPTSSDDGQAQTVDAQPKPVAFYNFQTHRMDWARPTTYAEIVAVAVPELPLYATPPQRQPLTIDEVEQILAQHDHDIHGDRTRYIVRMTEKAHGIGGDK